MRYNETIPKVSKQRNNTSDETWYTLFYKNRQISSSIKYCYCLPNNQGEIFLYDILYSYKKVVCLFLVIFGKDTRVSFSLSLL